MPTSSMTASCSLRRLVLTLCLLTASLVPVGSAHAARNDVPVIHLIAIGDSLDSRLGPKLAQDARNMATTFEQAFARAGRSEQLQTHLILGEDARPRVILDLIARLPIKSNDTLLVYDSAHGVIDGNNRHLLAFDEGRLLVDRADLLAAMKARSPRLAVLLTDVCSGYLPSSGLAPRPLVPATEPVTMNSGSTMEWATIRSLFLQHSGVIDMTAAEPGYNALADSINPGSMFTNALVKVLKTPYAELVRNLDRDGDREIQWDEILPQVRGLAARVYQNQVGLYDHAQQAFALSLGVWTPGAVSVPVRVASGE